MSNETLKKPSERIGERLPAIRETIEKVTRAALDAQPETKGLFTDAVWAEFKESPDGRHAEIAWEVTALTAAILENLDSEAERRAAWEAKVEANQKALAVMIMSCARNSVSAETRLAYENVEALSKAPVNP